MKRLALIIAALTALLATTAPAAIAAAIAHYAFDSGVDSAWSESNTVKIGERKVLGLFNNRYEKIPSSATLRLAGLPEGAALKVSFDLYYVGCWDSDGELADRFSVSADDGALLFEKTEFPCRLVDGDEKKPVGNAGTLKTRKYVLGYWIETLSFTVAPSHVRGGAVELEFTGELTGRSTEYWGLDNVRVETVGE